MRVRSRIWVKLENALWERRLGISTRASHGHGGDQPELHSYGTVAYRAIFKILRFLSLKNTDVFVDIGCGMGRVICCAARYDLAEVIGVEYLPDLCEATRRNVGRLHGGRVPIAVVNARAESFDFTRGSIFYLFNPFGPEILSAVLSKLRSGLDAREREIKVVYVNPLYEEVLARTPWLTRYGTLADWRLSGFGPTSFWISQTR